MPPTQWSIPLARHAASCQLSRQPQKAPMQGESRLLSPNVYSWSERTLTLTSRESGCWLPCPPSAPSNLLFASANLARRCKMVGCESFLSAATAAALRPTLQPVGEVGNPNRFKGLVMFGDSVIRC